MVRTISGALRTKIGQKKSRIINAAQTASDLLKIKLLSKDTSARNKLLEDAQLAIAKLSVAIDNLKECDAEWNKLISTLEDEESIAEEVRLYGITSTEGDDGGFQNVLDDAQVTLRLLTQKVAKITNPPEEAESTSKTDSKNKQSDNSYSSFKCAKLPQMPLPRFDGDTLKWHNFWSIFDSTIGQQKLNNVQKYNYLFQQLDGIAHDAVDHMEINDNSYDDAVKILKSRFQRDPILLQMALISEIKHIPQATNPNEIRKNFDACARILRQLKSAGADINTQSISLDLWSKYSPSIVKEITQRHNVQLGSTSSEIQTAIESYLNESELLSTLLSDVKPFVQQKQSPKFQSKPSFASSPQSEAAKFPQTPPTSAMVASEKSDKADIATTGAKPTKTPTTPRSPCHFCAGDHFNSDCNKYTTFSQRTLRLTTNNRCSRCFSLKHNSSSCKTPSSSFSCFYCKVKGVHKSALCPIKFANKSANGTSTKVAGTCSMGMNENGLLLTAITTITNPVNGASRKVRVMLDTGSHRSYITQALASQLNCDITTQESLQIAVFGSKQTWDINSGRVSLDLSVRTSAEPMHLDVNVIPLITESYYGPGDFPDTVQKQIKALDYAMADNFDPATGPPDLLIGSEYFWQLIRGEPIKLTNTLFLVPTTLGLILSGSYASTDERQSATLVCLTERSTPRCLSSALESISCETRATSKDPDVDEFWSLESIGISDDPVSNDDDKAMEQFNSTVRFENNRYQICWPWNCRKDHLPSNYQLAAGRLQSLAKRLSSMPRPVVDEYNRVIEEQEKYGIIERVPIDEVVNTQNATHYLPHHPVVRSSHETTKVRIVYDASAKCGKHNVSLNECMYRGPVILPDLCAILLRFRMQPIAIVADIEKAFLQIELQLSERDVTRFLWFNNPASPTANHPVVFRFARVPFGVISSPFILGATIQFHLNKVGTDIAMKIRDNTYVDNVIISAEDANAASKIYSDSKHIFADASMNLRQWCSNSEELMGIIPADDQTSTRNVRVLGLQWNSQTDKLSLCCNWDRYKACKTKREILKAIASIYDPLGFFQPCTLKVKLLLRQLWTGRVEWDEPIRAELQQKWHRLHSALHPIFNLSIPRHLNHQSGVDFTLVAFCDASKEAYATAVYLVATLPIAASTLIYAKSRLSPKSHAQSHEEVSIPRLELLGVVIAAKALEFVRQSLKELTLKAYVLTDSMITLGWLQSRKPLPVFIANRVNKIKQTSDIEFQHVSGLENPADLLTRGLTGQEIANSTLWWEGPNWLIQEPTSWPTSNTILPETSGYCDSYSEKPSQLVYHTFLAGEDLRKGQYPFEMDPKNYSSFRRITRITARCLKFIKFFIWDKLSSQTIDKYSVINRLLRSFSVEPIISAAELIETKQLWLKATQKSELGEVLKWLSNKKPSSLVKQLNVYQDEGGLLRCFGRFGYSDLSFEAIHPILLPKNCHVTSLIIDDVHKRLFHAGISHTLSQLRRQYWIPHGRNAVRKVINRCIVCRKLNGASYALPGMPPWPRERVSRSTPFQYTGVDYMGPINVSVLDTTQKMWVSLYTCLATRAIHLECVENCSSTSFIQCLSRFISRRGAPTQMISDNAPQFRLSKTLFDKTWKSVVEDSSVLTYISNKSIQWKFTTALAPWQGGYYERMVGLVKSSFKAVVGRKLLKREEFITVIAEIESIVNSRPLTYVCSDSKSGLALRPIDFLIDQPAGTPMVDDNIKPEGGDASKALLRFWKAKQRRLNSLWRQFYDDYLLSLRERFQTKHRKGRSDVLSVPKVHQIVLIRNPDNAPRGTWKLGRITRIIPSRDGEVRSVELLLHNKLKIERAVNHLYPLEVPTCEEQNSKSITPVDFGGCDEEDFEGFKPADLEDVSAHLIRLEQAVQTTTTACASARVNLLSSLSTVAGPVLF